MNTQFFYVYKFVISMSIKNCFKIDLKIVVTFLYSNFIDKQFSSDECFA